MSWSEKGVWTAAMSLILPGACVRSACPSGLNESLFHTWTPVLKVLARKYHVYGVEQRGEGPTTQYNPDGSVHWSNQWGEDLYQFCGKLGIEKFHYVGKCHGILPGWWMVAHHPEMLRSFCSFYLAPRFAGVNEDSWGEVQREQGRDAHLLRLMRKKENLHIKTEEMLKLGSTLAGIGKITNDYVVYGINRLWESQQAMEECVANVEVPICQMFGVQDPLYTDWLESNQLSAVKIKNARTVLLQGEYHLMEMDCPERIGDEAAFFIESTKKNYG